MIGNSCSFTADKKFTQFPKHVLWHDHILYFYASKDSSLGAIVIWDEVGKSAIKFLSYNNLFFSQDW